MDRLYRSPAFVLGCLNEFPSLWPSASAAPSAWEWHFLHLGNQRPGITNPLHFVLPRGKKNLLKQKKAQTHLDFVVSCLPVQDFPVQSPSASSPLRTNSELTAARAETTSAGFCPTGAAQFWDWFNAALNSCILQGFFSSSGVRSLKSKSGSEVP